MSPRRVDKDQRRRDIALTALDVFAEKGFEATSVEQVAKAANLSKGTIYLYFESKEDLFFQAVAGWADDMVQQTGAVVSNELEPAERLRALVHAMVEMFVSDQRSVRIAGAMFQLYLTNPQLLRGHDVTRQLFRGARKVVADVLRDGVSRGAFSAETASNAEKTAVNLLAYLDGIALHHYMSGDYFDLLEQVDLYLDNLISSLSTGDRKRGNQ